MVAVICCADDVFVVVGVVFVTTTVGVMMVVGVVMEDDGFDGVGGIRIDDDCANVRLRKLLLPVPAVRVPDCLKARPHTDDILRLIVSTWTIEMNM